MLTNSALLRPGVLMAGTVIPGNRSPTAAWYCSSERRQIRVGVGSLRAHACAPGDSGTPPPDGDGPGMEGEGPPPDEPVRSATVPTQADRQATRDARTQPR